MKERYDNVKKELGWTDEQVWTFFGYKSKRSFERSSGAKTRKLWLVQLYEMISEKKEIEIRARIVEEIKDGKQIQSLSSH